MFWVREALGWVLVATGLYVFYQAMAALLREGPFILEGPLFITIGFIIFRGGLQLIKIGVAGRVCLQAQKAALAHEDEARRLAGAPVRKLPLRRAARET